MHHVQSTQLVHMPPARHTGIFRPVSAAYGIFRKEAATHTSICVAQGARYSIMQLLPVLS